MFHAYCHYSSNVLITIIVILNLLIITTNIIIATNISHVMINRILVTTTMSMIMVMTL